MSELIEVFLRSPTDGRRLHPHYDEDADILEVGASSQGEWPYGVDVNGNVVFVLDASRILSNFDVLIGRRYWKRGDLHWEWPDGDINGSWIR